jgi:hypothetical protein
MFIAGTDDIEITADGLTISASSHNNSQRTADWLMERTAGTYLQGCITMPFARLVELFGAPYQHAQSSGDGKVRAEWHIKVFAAEDDDDGDTFSGVATIYDWKQALPVGSVTQWNIGGKDPRVVHYLSMLIKGVPSEWNARTY